MSRFFTVVLLFAFAAPLSCFALTIKVCSDCQFASIKAAVESASDGDTVEVASGLYAEQEIVINKSLHVRGVRGQSIVDGENMGRHIFIIERPGARLSDLVIRNTGSSYLEEISGVRVKSTERCEIVGNIFENATYGVYLENSKNCLVQGNTFRSEAADEASGGNGIHLWQGDGISLIENDIQGHRDGIYFEFVKNTLVRGNLITRNIRYGLHFMSSNDCVYAQNTFIKNGAGVAVMYSRRISMSGNKFLSNTGVAAYGLLLKEIYDGKIEDNDFGHNTISISMEGSNRNVFSRNRIHNNGWAIRITGDCEDNVFTQNDFLDNTFDVTTNSERNPNTFNRNYWSQYDGYDMNRDGIGDIPYRPVSLSSVIMENVDSSFVLVKSFLLILLDGIERSLPELIPERMKDVEPMMARQAAGQ